MKIKDKPLILENEALPIAAICSVGYPVLIGQGKPGKSYTERNMEASMWLQMAVEAYNSTYAKGINPSTIKCAIIALERIAAMNNHTSESTEAASQFHFMQNEARQALVALKQSLAV